jgi:hypothetical protein
MIVVVTLVLLPVLYLLSPGPAYWLYSTGWIRHETYNRVFGPAFDLAERSGGDSGREAFLDYVRLWSPKQQP